ncbi:3-hydroxyacyl-CoA dehydrogenase/enoyl-CoA hydratase family protein [Azospira sp. I09]|uniref:3-hydroxyacyl-CoA dehydrogenase/enoyl-CoA hydratase family protein n=1 Tax=Azospira sp. I09 TaxID=1765049 RepID=UPI00126047F6|nr:3-hydroxyacyl-CoA dehydrogenase/enoyl-CoA hydratase family protein [Azospira sp. I09]BBN89822.1 3-hydroxyacyl-CoA dehydrogenase oxidoreductase [Azospira sp. I09]BBN90897.1 3-hydroxyacyl-CoA dehydrogenase oxidoreductase [Azospira sp. I09]
MKNLIIRKVAVLGAGVMGAQIAAHLANANVPVVLFDLPAKDGDKNGVVKKALDGLKRLQPSPLVTRDKLQYIDAANYDDNLELLSDCDLVIEAIAERMDWKNDLYAKIGPFLSSTAIFASNTSGLSINALADALPAALRPNFCGIHFFNPPRYMPLVEIIATRSTAAATLDGLETWLTSRLGKGVVRALDTPNFVANRIGVFSILSVMHHTQAFALGLDTVDALTGPKVGRPKSATYRTGDVVGLDTLAHVVKTMQDTLPDDPWHAHFSVPNWLAGLIEQGVLGQKTKGGIFRKQGKEIQVFDVAELTYRPSSDAIAGEVAAALKIADPVERLAALRTSAHPQAQFLWSIFRDLFHYCAVQLEHVADNARDVDFALRWGFGWAQGPFELWQAAGWAETAEAIAADIAAGKAMSNVPLPAWVTDPARNGVHGAAGSWSASRQCYVPRSTLPVYDRQLFPELLLGEAGTPPETAGETLFENDGVRLWCLPTVDAGIGIISFKSKMHAIGDEVLDGVQAALQQAAGSLDGLVIWHEAPFAVGANLKQISEACTTGDFDRLERTINKFQQTSMAIKYAPVPVIAAVQGMALGGGCEFAMHAAKRVLALESYLGLVEVGVGLIPAGGGSKELALRAARWAGQSGTPGEVMPNLSPTFMALAMAKVSKSAHEAIDLGFGNASDTIRFNARELLFVALKEARLLADVGYVPPVPARGIPVAGRTGIATLEMNLVNMIEGGMISAHDYRVSRAVAVALCGGEVEYGSLVDEDWLLAVERQQFLELLKTPETQARIKHMLDTGKPLRN